VKYADRVHRFYLDLPKSLPEEIVTGTVVYELDLGNGAQTVRLIRQEDGLMALRLDTLVADRVEHRMLSPLIERDAIEVVAEQVISGNQRILTWQYTPLVLAMGTLIGPAPVAVVDPLLPNDMLLTGHAAVALAPVAG
jgi:hypothetical protein